MKTFAVLCAILSAFGEDSYFMQCGLTQVNMYLTVFTVNLLLAADLTIANHVCTVFHTSCFEPRLPTNFDTKLDQVFGMR